MSRTIDERVVSMQFDNKNFEKNVSTSMSTIEKLKHSLKLDGASKGLEHLSSQAKKCDMTPLANSADKVSLRFSAMYTAADQILRNLVNSAEHAAKRIVSAFTIDPIKTGFQEYETQINAVQTILANTQSKGSTLSDVNSALDELNKYADMTIYNFTEMTRNIGTFTAAGVELDKAVTSIKGIANLAAVSGSTSQQASTAMYQLSQALASGKVSLMDWNSVVNAGMGGQLFQDALKRTATQMGTNVDALIKKYGSFRESLTQGEWLTAEVLTETLTQLSGAYSEAELIAQGYTEEQARQIAELADTAVNAATKVKTFTQLMDTLKEAAQSGWTQTWELLIGDFEESKAMWTKVSDVLGGFINETSESRNKVLAGALDSNWEKMLAKMAEAGITAETFEEKVKMVAEEHGLNVDELTKKYGSLEKAIREGAISSNILEKAVKKLSKSTADLSIVDKILRKGDRGDQVKQIQQALKDLGHDIGKTGVDGIIGKNTEAAIKAFQELKGLKVTGIVDAETLAALKEATKASNELYGSVRKFISGIDELGGRELLLESFSNIFSTIGKYLKAIATAFRYAFKPMTSEQLYKIIEGFHAFTETLYPSGETLKKITTIFRGLFHILEIGASIIGGTFGAAVKFLWKVLSNLDLGILDLGMHAGAAIIEFRNWFFENNILAKSIDAIAEGIANAIVAIREWFTWFKNLPIVQENIARLRDAFKTAFSDIGDFLSAGWERIKALWQLLPLLFDPDDIIGSLRKIWAIFRDYILGYFLNIDFGAVFETIRNAFKNLWKDIGDYLEKLGTSFEEIRETIGKFLEAIKKNIGDNMGGILAIGVLLAFFLIIRKIKDVMESLAHPFEPIGEFLESLSNACNAFAAKLKAEAVKSIATSITMLAGAIFILAMLPPGKLWSAVGAITVISGVLWALVFFLNKAVKTGKDGKEGIADFGKLALSIAALAGAFTLIAIAAKIIGSLNPTELKVAGGAIIVFIGVFAALSAISTKLPGGHYADKLAMMMIELSGAMLVASVALKIIAGMDCEELTKSFLAFGVFMGTVVGVMAATKLLAKHSSLSFDRFGGMMLSLSSSLLIASVAFKIIGGMDWEELGKAMLAFGSFMGTVVGLMAATKLLEKDLPKFGLVMTGISMGLLSMALAIKILAGMNVGDIVKGGLVVAACMGLMAGMMKATQLMGKYSFNAAKAGLMFLSFAGAMVILAGSIALLSVIDPGDIRKALGAITAVSTMLAGLLLVSKFAKNCKATIISLSIAIGALALSLAALTFIEDPSKLDKAVMSLSIVMGMFGVLLASTKLIGSKTVATVSVMAGVIVLLAGSIYLLAQLPADGAVKTANAISILILSLSASCAILGAVGMMGSNVFIGVGVLAAVLAVLGIMAAITIASLPAIGKKLSEFMKELDGFLEGAECITPDKMKGVEMLADVLLTLTKASFINSMSLISLIPGMSPLERFGRSLVPFAKNLGEFSDELNKHEIKPSAITAVTDVIEPLVDMATKLTENTSVFQKWFGVDLSWFGGTLKGLGSGLAEFDKELSSSDISTERMQNAADAAGPLLDVASQLSEKTSIFKHLAGINLGWFGTTLTGFADGLVDFDDAIEKGAVDKERIEGAVEASTPLIELANLLSEKTSVFDRLFGINLSWFGSTLGGFAIGLDTLSTKLPSTLNVDKIKLAAEAASPLVDLATTITKDANMWDKLFKVDLSWFGGTLGAFADGLITFNDKITSTTINSDSIADAATAAEPLVDMAANLAANVSVWQKWNGVDLSWFGTTLTNFANGLIAFDEAISEGDINKDRIGTATEAATPLVDMAAKIGENVSVWQKWNGVDLSWIGSTLGSFGSGIVAFNDSLADTTFDTEKMTAATDAASPLVDLAVKLAENVGVWEKLTGQTLSGFGDTLGNFGGGLATFSSKINEAEFDQAKIDSASSIGTVFADLAKTVADNSAGWDWIMGKEGLDDFGLKLEGFGESLSIFAGYVSGETFSIDAVKSALTEAEKIVALANTISDSKEESVDLSTFGLEIEALGLSLANFCTNIADVDSDKFAAVANGLNALSKIDATSATTVQSFISSLGDVAVDGIDAFVDKFGDAEARVVAAISVLIDKAITGISNKEPDVKTAFESVVATAIAAIKTESNYEDFKSAGKYLVEGLAEGIENNSSLAEEAAASVVKAAETAARDAGLIESPSKVWYRLGAWTVEGYTNALHDGLGDVYSSGYDVSEAAKNGLNSAISKMRDVVELGFDTQPTIRPVLDLSDVSAGARSINGILDMRPSMGVMANVNAISSMMNARRQNGSNRDVVSAIEDLGRKMGEKRGDTYQFGNITYDDNSSINAAVKTLVRAAKVERRK